MSNTSTFDLLARDRASGVINKVGDAFAKTEGKAHGMARAFSAVSVGTRGVHASFGMIATGAKAASVGLAAAAVAGATMGIKTAASLEQAQVAFTTLLHSGTKAQTFIKGLSKFAASTPFELPGLIDSSRILLGVGMAANKVIPFLQDFGDTAGAVGIQQDGFNRIILAMSQSISAGTIKLGDMNQLMDNGLPIWKLLSEALGKPVSKIQDLISHGKLLTKDVLPKLQAQMHKDYGGAMAKQSQTLSGLWSTFMDTLNIGLAQSIQPLIPALKSGLSGAIGFVGTALSLIPKVAGPVIAVLQRVFGFVRGTVLPGFAALRAAFSGEGITSNGFVGVMERIGVAGRTAVGFIKKTLIPGFQGLASAFSGEGVTSDGFVGVMENIGVIGKQVVDYITKTIVPNIATAFGTVKVKIATALSGIDLSGIARTFATEAAGWGTALIDGVRTGLETGDWSALGQTVGKGIAAAIEGAGQLAKTIGSKIGDLLGKVDWVGIGISVGKQAPSLLIGIAAGILNFDLGGLLKGLWQHWQDVLIGVLVLAFAPVKIIGKVGEALARIPIVGRLLAWALDWAARFSRGLVRMVGDALGTFFTFLGREFLAGFRTVFPRVGAALTSWLRLLPTRIGVAALDVAAAARRMITGLGNAIRSMAGWVVRNIGQLIAQMIQPWVDAGRWLVGYGRRIVSGLWGGISAAWGGVARWFAGIGSRVGGWFAGAGRWLWSAGRDIIGGIWSGIRNAMTGVGRILGEVKDAIVGGLKRLFGISSPSTVMAGLGGHIITGLIKGLLTKSGALARTVRSIGGNVANIFGATLGNVGGGLVPDTRPGSVQAMVKGYAQMMFGWQGAQWDALYKLIMRESGFNPNAQNPTSTAYGIFQFLDSTWAAFGVAKSSNPNVQTIAGLQYIRQRYGDPGAAWAHEMMAGWYGGGMPPTVFDQPTLIGVGDRGAETVTITPHARAGGAAGGLTEAQIQRAFVAALRDVGMTGGGVGREVGLTMAKFVPGGGRR